MTDAQRRERARELSKKLRDAVMRAPIGIDAAEAMEIPLLTALADAERRGMEPAAWKDTQGTDQRSARPGKSDP